MISVFEPIAQERDGFEAQVFLDELPGPGLAGRNLDDHPPEAQFPGNIDHFLGKPGADARATVMLSHEHPDERVRLGRVTEWVELDDGREAPTGQNMLLVDGDDFPFLEVRELEIDGPASEE